MRNYEHAGVGMIPRPENKKRVVARIERMRLIADMDRRLIADMDRRHIELLDAGDYAGLRRLAQEYHDLGAVGMAARIRNEAG